MISSLHMESWRNNIEIGKTPAIQQWIERVLDRMEHYEIEHKVLCTEGAYEAGGK